MILDEIVAKKRLELNLEHMSYYEKEVGGLKNPPPDFKSALKKTDRIAVIAEVKKASPSKGVFDFNFEPVGRAKEFESLGADAISVLTEKNYFLGSLESLEKIGRAVKIPLLRKDFIIDIRELYEARLAGASAALLIVSILNGDLKAYLKAAKAAGIAALTEARDEREIETALNAGAGIIGINNRDLRTFETDLKTTERLARLIPEGIVVVSESGVKSAADVSFLRDAGADAVLVGEAFSRSKNIKKTFVELLNG